MPLAQVPLALPPDTLPPDTLLPDSTDERKDTAYRRSAHPVFKLSDRYGDPFANRTPRSPFMLKLPSNIEPTLEVDDSLKSYAIDEKFGETDYRAPSTMTFEELQRYRQKQLSEQYWRSRSEGLDGESAVSGRNLIPKIYISPVFDRIFGGNFVDIRPNGSVMLDFGGQFQRVDNPALPIRAQRSGNFLFDNQINMNVIGKIGEKLQLNINWDTKASFDFENNIRLEYTGFDHEVIQKIEAGNVSLPMSSSLISGGQNLFGVKAQLQFGRWSVTGIASNQRGKSETISVTGGAQTREFEIRADNYDDNRHFFLSHFFRQNYEKWLSRLPLINSSVQITRVEVYVTNRNNVTNSVRNVVGMMDLGETDSVYNDQLVNVLQAGDNVPTANGNNDLFRTLQARSEVRNSQTTASYLEEVGFANNTDFSFIKSARRLEEGRDFTLQSQLGYISLITPLRNDDVLAVSYEYTYRGKTYKVGETVEDYQGADDNQTIILKLLRPASVQRDVPMWNLMMKNVYNLNASQLSADNFKLRIIYKDDASGVDNPSLHETAIADKPLLQVFGLDQLNPARELQVDGNFDFIEGVTIDPTNGRVYFPRLEPFGSYLASQLGPPGEPQTQAWIDKYVFDELYRSTRSDALLSADKNKFFLKGSLQSSSSNEIALPGINIAQGSVVVLAGGVPLQEGADYRVDYNLGRVTILNQGVLSSNQEVSVRFEKADLFNFQQRSLFGARTEYKVSENLLFGGTVMHLNERPIISRVSVGDEPTNNTIWGADINWKRESRFLTRMIDKLPIVQTKEPSQISFYGEVAQLLPGAAKSLDPARKDNSGRSFLDDFEGSETGYNVGNRPFDWMLSSTPSVFPESKTNGLEFAYRRAKLAWYSIDNVFYFPNATRGRPEGISDADMANHYVRFIGWNEIFQQRDKQAVNLNQTTFDLAYYPDEPGPYNYNPNLDADGTFGSAYPPERNWAGITQAINFDTDFDNANVQYLEFWLLDPFISGPNGREVIAGPDANAEGGGQLYINLGNVSEDVMKDNQHAFENGLPTPDDPAEVVENEWGRVTQQQFLTNAFNNTAGARDAQDIGLDGVKSQDGAAQEASYFSDFLNNARGRVTDATALSALEQDPSRDDFTHYLDGRYDEVGAKVLQRYKNYNNMEGNSPANDGNSFYTPAYTNLPDNEDLNSDNTVNSLESYYQYRLDLQPGRLQVGQNYVVDQVEVTSENGQPVNWYQIRIPIRDLSQPGAAKVGNISDFKTIRFMRLYMTGFRRPVILRMAEMQMVANQWREYTKELREEGEGFEPEDNSTFRLSTVNIEENGDFVEGQLTPYVSPPGVQRDRDATSIVQRRLNEQSLSLCVDDLAESQARAAFKNVSFDFRNYKRLKMYLHAEAQDAQTGNEQISAFFRLGTDLTDNYYEIEVPLTLTPPGTSGDQADVIWPRANEIDIAFEELYGLKAQRNRDGVDPLAVYPTGGFAVNGEDSDLKQIIRVKGNPDLSSVQTMMIGIRNPTSPGDPFDKAVCIWADELRVTDFDKQAGWAAVARLNMKLADVATVTAAGRYETIGFGSIDQKIAQRAQANTSQFSISSNVALDKFTPQRLGMRIPMFVSYDVRNVEPRFDPLDPDVPLEASISSLPEDKQDEYRRIVQTHTERKSLNFTGVQKTKVNPEANSYPWDIENVNLTYAFSEEINTSPTRELYVYRNTMGAVGYNYNSSLPPFEPFKNVKWLSSPYLKAIKEFNIAPLPSNVAIRAELTRQFQKEQLRGADVFAEVSPVLPTFEKAFTFTRTYAVTWALTKALSLTYNANVLALIDEPPGDVTEAVRDSIWQNVKKLGRIKNYNQTILANYRLPLDKLPLTDWVAADIQYSAGYNWQAAPLGLSDDSSNTFGNVVQNNRSTALNGRVDMLKLYNKVKFLKEINSPTPQARGRGGQPPRPQPKPGAEAAADSTEKKRPELKGLKAVLRALMTARSINFTYSRQEGTLLPDYFPTVSYFGIDRATGAPGWPFVLGSQDPDIRFTAARNGWLGNSPDQSRAFDQSLNESFTANTRMEPFKDFAVQLQLRKTKTTAYSEYFVWDPEQGTYVSQSPSKNGNFSMTFISIKTAFSPEDTGRVSGVFREFEANRAVILDRLNRDNPGSDGESFYSLNHQDVLIPAFLAAYSGRDVSKASTALFPRIPLPNWRLDYAGLSKLPALSKTFSAINIKHSYASTYAVGSFQTSLDYPIGALTLDNNIEYYNNSQFATIRNPSDTTGAAIPLYVTQQVTIQEQFSPLIGIDLRTKSKLTFRLDYNRGRNLGLSLTNRQITEVTNQDLVFGFGFNKSNLRLPFRVNGEAVVLKNEVQFRTDLTFRDSRTIQRSIDGLNQITAGVFDFQFRPQINYQVNQRLNLQGYFERIITNPKISTSYPRRNTRFGIQLRFALS